MLGDKNLFRQKVGGDLCPEGSGREENKWTCMGSILEANHHNPNPDPLPLCSGRGLHHVMQNMEEEYLSHSGSFRENFLEKMTAI